MTDELKPCPFCGSPARVEYHSGNENINQQWWVACTSSDCSAVTRSFFGSNTWGGPGDLKTINEKAKQNAKEFWNRRAPPPPAKERSLTIDFETRLTSYGMLVRALRIVANTTLYHMAQHLSSTPATLSSVEFGRKPLTDAMVADTAAYFSSLGIHDTLHALNVAAHPTSGAES